MLNLCVCNMPYAGVFVTLHTTNSFYLSLSLYVRFQFSFFPIPPNYIRQKQQKKYYVEHFIISNTFIRHFVRKKKTNTITALVHHIRILVQILCVFVVVARLKYVPIIMHFHCINSIIHSIFFCITQLHSSHPHFWWFFKRFSSTCFIAVTLPLPSHTLTVFRNNNFPFYFTYDAKNIKTLEIPLRFIYISACK